MKELCIICLDVIEDPGYTVTKEDVEKNNIKISSDLCESCEKGAKEYIVIIEHKNNIRTGRLVKLKIPVAKKMFGISESEEKQGYMPLQNLVFEAIFEKHIHP